MQKFLRGLYSKWHHSECIRIIWFIYSICVFLGNQTFGTLWYPGKWKMLEMYYLDLIWNWEKINVWNFNGYEIALQKLCNIIDMRINYCVITMGMQKHLMLCYSKKLFKEVNFCQIRKWILCYTEYIVHQNVLCISFLPQMIDKIWKWSGQPGWLYTHTLPQTLQMVNFLKYFAVRVCGCQHKT